VTISKLGCLQQPHMSVLKDRQRIAYHGGCGSQSGAQKFACHLGHDPGTIPSLNWKHLRLRRCKCNERYYDRRMCYTCLSICLFSRLTTFTPPNYCISASFTHLILMKGHVDLVIYKLLIRPKIPYYCTWSLSLFFFQYAPQHLVTTCHAHNMTSCSKVRAGSA